MIEAYREHTGRFRLANSWDATVNQVYRQRARIQAAGGTFTGIYWTVPASALAPLCDIVTIMRRVRVGAFCHEQEGEMWASDEQLKRGYIRRGCGHCETFRAGGMVPILEVVDDCENSLLEGSNSVCSVS